jgi:hypothetical protein
MSYRYAQGGALWFQNLTSTPHGIIGCTFPFIIAGLHYANVQVWFFSLIKAVW